MSKKTDLRKYLEALSEDALIGLYIQKCFDTDVEKSDLAEQLALTKKALELACSYIWEISGREDCPNSFSSEEFDEINKCNCVHDERNINGKCWIELFKYDAKKELEKSKGDNEK